MKYPIELINLLNQIIIKQEEEIVILTQEIEDLNEEFDKFTQ